MRARAAVKAVILAAVVAAAVGGAAPSSAPAPLSAPGSNLDWWLGQATTATTAAATAPAGGSPFAGGDRFSRADALPGVVELSDGRLLAGGVYTTRDKDWEVWVEAENRWRHVPPILVLSIRAVVIEEELDKEWRWKEMGSDEKVFTGRLRPKRRTDWRLRLIDGSELTGSIKGQPVWVDDGRRRHGPFVLHERALGDYGQSLADLVYVRAVVISRRAMEEARGEKGAVTPAPPS